jgi:hypothetical protein
MWGECGLVMATEMEAVLRVRAFLRVLPPGASPRCRLLLGFGLSWGERQAPEPQGTAAIWLFRHSYLASRTQVRGGAVSEHFKRRAIVLSMTIGRREWRLEFPV